jgi:methyltransferase-like protein
MQDLQKVFKKSDSMVSRKIGSESILVPIRQNAGDLDSIYTLNDTAAYIWELIDGKKSVGEIKKRILDEFEVTSGDVERDLGEHLQQLRTLKAIVEG